MFYDHIKVAVETAPVSALDKIMQCLFEANGAGAIADDEAQSLAELIQARRNLAKADVSAPQVRPARSWSYFRAKRSTPVYDRRAARHRRRIHARARWLPDTLAPRFTDGELAALSVIAQEHLRHGRSTLPMAKIAALAGVSETTARNAFREAKQLHLIEVEERPQYRAKNLPNVIVIVDTRWIAWLARRPASWSKTIGCTNPQTTQSSRDKKEKTPLFSSQGGRQRHRFKGIRQSRADQAGPSAPPPDAPERLLAN